MVSVCDEVSEKYDASRVEKAKDEDTLSIHFTQLALKIEKSKNKEFVQYKPITFYAFARAIHIYEKRASCMHA